MGWRNRVVWTEGMFLEPHHFQQELRYIERLVDARMAGANAHAWGFVDFEIDEGLLALGKLGLVRAVGVLPDGTPFSMPQYDPLPPALDLATDMKSETICLAVPLQREGSDEFALDDGKPEARMSRYLALQEDVRDAGNASDEPTTIQTGRLQAQPDPRQGRARRLRHAHRGRRHRAPRRRHGGARPPSHPGATAARCVEAVVIAAPACCKACCANAPRHWPRAWASSATACRSWRRF